MADLWFLLPLLFVFVAAEIRGIDPAQTHIYNKPSFSCFDASKEIPHEAVNDNYCDCPDGSDEPGTSACPRGKFYCRNKGYRPKNISSCFVDDGVCDCCDGSDEKEGNCPHTCYPLGEKIRIELKDKIAIYQKSLTERARRTNEAKGIKEKWKEELKHQEEELDKQRARCDRIKARLDVLVAEEKRKEAAEANDDAEETIVQSSDQNSTEGEGQGEEEPDTDGDGEDDAHVEWDGTGATHEEGTEEVDTQEEEEEGHETEDETEDGSEEEDETKEGEGMEYTETVTDGDDDASEADHGKYADETSEEDHTEGHTDRDGSDSVDVSSPPLFSRLKRWGRSLWPGKKTKTTTESSHAPDEDPSVDDRRLDTIRRDYSKEKRELGNIEKRRDALKSKIDRTYGSDGRWTSLVDHCFEGKHDKYTYVICPFDRAEQKDGHRSVNLGRFHAFEESTDTMHFKNGQGCPGKRRSLELKLVCGENEIVTRVEEPTVCDYTAKLSTPVACTESELKILKAEAREMGVEGMEDTDEETRTDKDTIKDEL